MKFIIIVMLGATLAGALFGLLGGGKGKKENALGGAAAGAFMAGSCLFELISIGAVVLLAIWVFKKVFL